MMVLIWGRESCASVYFGFFLRAVLEGPLVVGDLEGLEVDEGRWTPGRVFCWEAVLWTLEAVELDLRTREVVDVEEDLLPGFEERDLVLLLLEEDGLPRDWGVFGAIAEVE